MPAGSRVSRRLLRWPARNYFADLEPRSQEGHPVDDLMARDPDLDRIRRRALRHLHRLEARPDSEALLDFEAERNHLDSARVEVAFNIGFESGLVAGRMEGLRMAGGRRRAAEEVAFARGVRSAATAARVSPGQSQAVLLELAWAIALGTPREGAPPVPASDSRRRSATRRRR
jgi:hypothetical protein